MKKRIVLLGAGHAHLHALKHAREFADRGHELTVIAPDTFWYSGLATGMLGGFYRPERDQVDVAALVAGAGGSFIQDLVVGLDPRQRLVHLASRPPLPYDVLSITLGSAPPAIPGGADGDRIYDVKPVRRLWDLRRSLEQRLAVGARGAGPRIVVAGAGPTGCEIAANIAQLAAARGGSIGVMVLAAGDKILEQFTQAARHGVATALERRGVVFRRNARVMRIEDSHAVLADGSAIGFDLFVNASGLKPAPILRDLGLPLDSDGALVTDEYLRSFAAPEVHGGGDCISFCGHALPRVGVYAIRQAPVLFHNLLAAAEGRPPRTFHPQRRFLLIMNLGDGTGLATRGSWHWQGAAAFRLKDWIDRRFLADYQSAARPV